MSDVRTERIQSLARCAEQVSFNHFRWFCCRKWILDGAYQGEGHDDPGSIKKEFLESIDSLAASLEQVATEEPIVDAPLTNAEAMEVLYFGSTGVIPDRRTVYFWFCNRLFVSRFVETLSRCATIIQSQPPVHEYIASKDLSWLVDLRMMTRLLWTEGERAVDEFNLANGRASAGIDGVDSIESSIDPGGGLGGALRIRVDDGESATQTPSVQINCSELDRWKASKSPMTDDEKEIIRVLSEKRRVGRIGATEKELRSGLRTPNHAPFSKSRLHDGVIEPGFKRGDFGLKRLIRVGLVAKRDRLYSLVDFKDA